MGSQGVRGGRWKRSGGGWGDGYTSMCMYPIPLNSMLKKG